MILEDDRTAARTGKFLASLRSGVSENVHQRAECDYKDLSKKFALQTKDYTKQFAHIYAIRLVRMREMITKRVRRKWGPDMPIRKLIDLKEEEHEKCVIIGTLFKHQELKPSILKEISEENQLIPQPQRTQFVDEHDQLILEDEQQRIHLVGSIDVHSSVTGIVSAVLGRDTGSGRFEVEDHCFASLPEPVERPLPIQENRFIILISGLGLTNNADVLLPLQMFVDWVGGYLGDAGDQQRQTQAVRVIIAGNSVRHMADHKAPLLSNVHKIEVEDAIKGTKLLDDFLAQLASFIDVDIMPGEFDPANHMLPQQPLHCCMFPQATQYETMHSVSNPYECEIGGRRILGTAGQPVDDVARYSKLTDPLRILEQTLEWAHLAPTCPDTLTGYPFYQEDPFIITDCPDIYFAGNQSQFQTALYKVPTKAP
ncbi:DNA polymerase delta subunit 2 isoform X2 [Anabrus simplex]|uniref:DNA polymerase delta subunit 2 isoform X2 n=1 Tax=Anabrus simplex TaxID=316456 RepID=UPI0035A289B3